MTDVQQRAIAAGFLHALQTTPALFQEWNAIPKDDASAIGALIQKTMGLTQAPSSSDLHAMAAHIDASLGDQVNALRASNPDAPSHVGEVFLTQQNS
jgi:hypothetical protein